MSDLFHSTQCPPGIHFVTDRKISFFLRLNNTPLPGINRVLLILSPVGGHVGCFHILAVVTTMVSRNTDVSSRYWFHFLGYIPGSEITGLYGSSVYFLRTSILFFIISEPVYIPISSSLFSTSLLTFVIFCLFC